jgi:LUD domain
MQGTFEAAAVQGQREARKAWESVADPRTVEKALRGLRARGFQGELVKDRREALKKVRSLIPAGASVMTGSSRTLDEIGFTQLLASGEHPWVNLKGKLLAEKDRERQLALRGEAIFADYFLGSVHAVTESGELVAGSASGSQLAAYAYGAKNLVLVAGTHKITGSLDEALRRLREHSVPLEDRRMKSLGYPGTYLAKILVLEKEAQRNVHVVLVNERLGF